MLATIIVIFFSESFTWLLALRVFQAVFLCERLERVLSKCEGERKDLVGMQTCISKKRDSLAFPACIGRRHETYMEMYLLSDSLPHHPSLTLPHFHCTCQFRLWSGFYIASREVYLLNGSVSHHPFFTPPHYHCICQSRFWSSFIS